MLATGKTETGSREILPGDTGEGIVVEGNGTMMGATGASLPDSG